MTKPVDLVGPTVKMFHWAIVVLLAPQLPLGWLMPDIHRDMQPSNAMTLHVSVGIIVLLLIILRFPVAVNSSGRA